MDRLTRLESRPPRGGGRLYVARTFRERLLGLAGLRTLPADCALLITGCASVHTAWMRFPIDVVFIGPDGRVLRVVEGLRPWRTAQCRGAAAVVETSAGQAERLGFATPATDSPAGSRPSAKLA